MLTTWLLLHFVWGRYGGKRAQEFSLLLKLKLIKIPQGLQILLMSGVTVTPASQILESFWNIWSQVSLTTKKAIFRLSSTWSSHVYTVMRDTQSSCGSPLTWKAQILDGGH